MKTVRFSLSFATIFVLFLFVLCSSAQAQQTTHAEDDLEWSRQVANEPAFVVDVSKLRVATANELNQLGQWSEIIDWPHTAVSAANLPDGRILTYASNEEDSWPAGKGEFTYAAAWDPATGEFKMVPHNAHDMFCAELVMTDDGKVFVTGGRNHVPTTSVFDFEQDTWSTIDDMNTGRWYPTSVSLSNGNVFTALGSSGGSIPEVWNQDAGWSYMNGIDFTNPLLNQPGWTIQTWPYLFVAPSGELFHAGPQTQMHYINLGGNGSIRETNATDKGWYGKRALNVMYEENKIMIAGGSAPYDSDGKNDATNAVVSIDISSGEPVLTPLASMNHPRVTHNGVLLPDGKLIVVGGRTHGGGDVNSVLTPEIYDPVTNTWTEVADMSVPRNYHSTALLMPDGRVWSGGGGFCANGCPDITHSNAQVYSPPYLFNSDGSLAARPEITTAPASVRNNEVFTLNATAGLTRFTMIKMSAITHQMNTDLRRLYVDFTESAPGTYELSAHANPNVMTPGYWMVFGLNADGVPSEAAIVQVTTEGVPQMTNPGIQLSSEGVPVSLQIEATDNDPLTFSATGLPPGLFINGSTGEISGIPAEGAAGSYTVVVTASDAIGGISETFTWTITRTQGEIGIVTTDQASSTQWHTVNLTHEYIDPVVVMGPPSFGGANPLTVRVRNVTSNSFEFQLDEWDYLDGAHGSETIGYMVVESGAHTLNDGRILQAGTLEASGNGWNTVTLNHVYATNPVILSQVGTANDPAAVTTRQRNVGPANFELQLEEEEGSANDHGTETVYWVAIEAGIGAEAIKHEAGITADAVTQNWYTIAFAQGYAQAPVFLAAFQTADGGDPVAMRYQNLNGSTIEIFAEEEQAANDETGHTQEVAGYAVFEAAGTLPFANVDIPPIVLTTPSDQSHTEGEAVSMSIAVEQDNGAPLTFSASGLPAGVSIDTNSGAISGGLVAGSAGTSSVTIEATDGISNGAVTFTWTVNAARGSWIDFSDESSSALSITSVPFDDSDEKDLAVGDLNKDGWDDIIVVRKAPFMESDARPDLLLMNEFGTLIDRTASLAPGFAAEPTIARDVIIEDLDGDGWDDVLIANTFGDQPSFYRNLGADASGWLGLADESSIRLPVLDAGSIQYCSIAAGDVNGDGAPDLYFSNYVLDGSTKDVLLINDGSGVFADEGESILGDLINVAFGTQADIIDIDNDGDNDIVKLSAEDIADPFNNNGIFVLYNQGAGVFSDWSMVPSDEGYMYIIGDFNNDTEHDFYVVNDGADYVNLANVVTENANITFDQQTTPWVRTAGHGANLRTGDLDHDGDLDIGVADVDTSFPPCEASDLRAFLLLENENEASGSFIDPFGAASKPWNTNMYDFAFIDLNKDGNLDIFSAECSGYGMYVSTQDPVEDPVEPVVLALGDLNMGIATHDQREGAGYIMYTEESVHTRFTDPAPSSGNADHLIAVVFENGEWKADPNKNNLTPFVPRATDHLLVAVDFGANTASHLIGVSSVIEGINAGYVSSDLQVTPEMWNGQPNEGEFGVTGSTVTIEAGNVQPPPPNEAPVLGAIGDLMHVVGDGVDIQLTATDADGDALTFSATSLPVGLSISNTGQITGTLTQAGTSNTTVDVQDGKGGSDSETFEWMVDGGDPVSTITLAMGDLNLGIAAHDQRVGPGYIMYSEESVHTRFADNPPSAWNADHLIAVVYDNGAWKVDRNKNVLVPFTPRSSDHLLAEVDFGADTVTHLAGVNTVIEGINAGFVSGDVVITAEMWGGSPNEGEFGVVGETVVIPGEDAQAAVGDGPVQSIASTDALPDAYELGSIYPNPFNSTTSIEYNIPESSSVQIAIYSVMGQRVRILLANDNMPAGTWRTIWDGTNDSGDPVATGMYIIQLQANTYTETGKVVLIR